MLRQTPACPAFKSMEEPVNLNSQNIVFKEIDICKLFPLSFDQIFPSAYAGEYDA